MQNESSTWNGSNITLLVSGVSATSVILGLLAIAYSKLSRGAGLEYGSLIPAADAGVAFVLLGISLGILAQTTAGTMAASLRPTERSSGCVVGDDYSPTPYCLERSSL